MLFETQMVWMRANEEVDIQLCRRAARTHHDQQDLLEDVLCLLLL